MGREFVCPKAGIYGNAPGRRTRKKSIFDRRAYLDPIRSIVANTNELGAFGFAAIVSRVLVDDCSRDAQRFLYTVTRKFRCDGARLCFAFGCLFRALRLFLLGGL